MPSSVGLVVIRPGSAQTCPKPWMAYPLSYPHGGHQRPHCHMRSEGYVAKWFFVHGKESMYKGCVNSPLSDRVELMLAFAIATFLSQIKMLTERSLDSMGLRGSDD